MRRVRRVPFRRQMTSTECGAACLAMILSAHGRHTRVSECRELLGIGRDGASGLHIVATARRLGLAARVLGADLDHLAEVRLPAVAHWDFSHFVVLTSWTARGAEIVDPGQGRRKVDRDEFSRMFTGVVLEFTPTPALDRRSDPSRGFTWTFLRSMTASARGVMLSALLASVLLQVLMLIPAIATRFTVDTVLGEGRSDLLDLLGIGVVLLVANEVLATWARGVLVSHLRARMDAAMMTRFFEHLLDLPYKYFQARGSGDLAMRLSSNTILRELLSGQSMSLLIDGAFLVGYLTLILALAPVYAALVLGFGSLLFLVVAATFRSMGELSQAEVGAQADVQNFAVEALTGIETVKSTGAENEVYAGWSGRFHVQLRASLRSQQLEVLQQSLLGGIRFATPLGLLWLSAGQVLSGTLSLGSALALNALAASMLGPLANIANGTRQLQLVATHVERIRDVLEETPEQDRSIVTPPTFDGAVELRGVGLRYSAQSPWALRGVTLALPRGSKIALVGRTGSGKSTLARMIIGLYEPDEGEIRFDGRPLRELDHRAVRGRCGVVVQTPTVFASSIRENIAFGHPGLALDQVVRAAQRAQLHEDVVAMPMGYDTVLGSDGTGLSGGQRQRLALARALVHDPALLVLDEATSNLDVITENRVDRVLSELSCTRVVVAHRLSTVRNADLIVVLDGGRIVECGDHDELAARGGRYADLMRGQLLARNDPTPFDSAPFEEAV